MTKKIRHYGQLMDLVDLIQEKRFLGQEFLAWLWYKSEERSGAIDIPGTGDVLVVFEKHMLLGVRRGEANETVICRGLQTELKEARAGLLQGKKPEQARLRLTRASMSSGDLDCRGPGVPQCPPAEDRGRQRRG